VAPVAAGDSTAAGGLEGAGSERGRTDWKRPTASRGKGEEERHDMTGAGGRLSMVLSYLARVGAVRADYASQERR
jgi:hypothetical protein